MQTQREIVMQWLTTLAALTGLGGEAGQSADRLVVYVPFLLQAVPIAALTAESVRAIARDCTHMPPYGQLVDKLEAWWSANRPDKPPCPPRVAYVPLDERVEIPKRREPPTEAEMAYVSGIVSAFRLNLSEQAARQQAVRPLPKAYVPVPVSHERLLAAYEQAGEAGVIRAAMLRRSLRFTPPEPRMPVFEDDPRALLQMDEVEPIPE